MRKILRALLAGLLIAATVIMAIPAMPVSADATLKDSWFPTNDSLIGLYDTNWVAQTWTAGSDYDISRVDLLIYRVGTLTTATVSIRATAAGVPDGADLTVSDALDVSELTPVTAGAWTTFWFPTPTSLTNGVVYSIVLRMAGGDASNRIAWRETSTHYTDGIVAHSTNSGSTWHNESGDDWDNQFKTYTGYNAPSVTTQYPVLVEETTATLFGNLTENGGDPTVDVSFEYGLTTGYGSTDTPTPSSISGGQFSKGITGLTAGTVYHYRVKAVNATGTTYGSDKIIRTIDKSLGEIDTNLDYTGLSVASERSVFATKGLMWMFYARNAQPTGYGSAATNLTYQYYGYRTSTDGTDWGAFTQIKAVTGVYSEHHSITFDGTYLHYILKSQTGNGIYRRGLPNADGTITWSAVEQTTSLPTTYKHPTISVDSNGYPIIGYSAGDGISHGYLVRSTNNAGYWITDDSFTKDISTMGSDPKIIGVPLTDGKVYLVANNLNTTAIGYLWSGSSWGGSESITATNSSICFNIQALGVDDDVYIAWRSTTPAAYFKWRDSSDNTWKTETSLYADANVGAPGLSYDSSGGVVYVFYTDWTNSIIYAKPFQDGVFGEQITIKDESATGLVKNDNYQDIQPYYYTTGTSLAIAYNVNSISTQTWLDVNPYILKVHITGIGISPEITTNQATNLSLTSATLQGTLVEINGYTTNVHFQYGLTTAYGTDTSWQSGFTTGDSFSQAITGLTPNTTYHYRAQGRWADGTIGNGIDRTFVTSTQVNPTVTTGDAISITQTTATLQGTLTSLGGYTPVYTSFQWGLTAAYGTNTVETTQTAITATNVGISGLTAGTTYHFRIRVRYTATDYVNGADNTFVTAAAGAPTVTTGSAVGVTSTAVTLQGTLTSLGDYTPVYVSFQYGPTAAYELGATVEQTYTTISAFTQAISGLSSGSTYHFRARVRYGAATYVNGNDNTFTTSSASPGAPINFQAQSGTADIILSWAAGTGAVGTVVRFSTETYPTTIADGVEIYRGILLTYTHSGLSSGVTYYYSAWSYSGEVYSTSRASSSGRIGVAGELPPPSSISIEDVKVFKSYIETNDKLVCISVKLLYDTIPIENVQDYFKIQVLEGAILKGQGVPSSWGYAPSSIYFSASSNFVWGTAYTVKLIGRDDKWTVPPTATYTLSTSNWIGSEMSLLDQWILLLASRLESYYATSFTSFVTGQGQVLNDLGGRTFERGISSLRTQRPNLFQNSYSEILSPGAPAPKVYNPVLDLGTDIETALAGLGTETGTDANTIGTIIWILITILVGGLVSTIVPVAGLPIIGLMMLIGGPFGVDLATVLAIGSVMAIWAIFMLLLGR